MKNHTRISPHQAPNRIHGQLQIINWVTWHDPFVQITIKRHLLHVLVGTHLHKCLPSRIRPVENLLQYVQNLVRRPISFVPFFQIYPQVPLVHHPLPVFRSGHNGLCAHPPTFGGEVYPLAGALGDVAGGVADEGDPVEDPSGPRVLRDGVGLDPDDLAAVDLVPGAEPGSDLEFLYVALVGDGAGADGHVVALWEDPTVEIRRYVVAYVHLGEVLVVLHLLFGDADPLLKGDGILVVAGADGFGDAGVGAVGADDGVDLEGFPFAGAAGLGVVVGVVEDVRRGFRRGEVHLEEEAVDDGGASCAGAVAEVGVEDLAADHPDVLVGLEGAADVDGYVGRRDHLHLGDPPVDDVQREVELADHAEGNGAAAGLAVVHLALDQKRLHAALGKGLRCCAAGGAAANHGDSEVSAGDPRAGFRGDHAESPARRSGCRPGDGFLRRGLTETDEGFHGDGGHVWRGLIFFPLPLEA
ncbi:smr (Small MutS Related) domain-containing protein [Striga asiatica]|uniref:Smr (Small MutS Related) domain-containing protein n=1 Tax=Striga asiatica TaxID=4170 RepID=A0A5A7QZT5_STRAF|nr:smr (Small MutS Related) domain-containing protein [Striga asiatica]